MDTTFKAILLNNEKMELPCYQTQYPGLVIARSVLKGHLNKRKWTVYHASSGFGITNLETTNLRKARMLADMFGPFTDWTRTAEELVKDTDLIARLKLEPVYLT